ncbi:hypothetical protein [Bradyrhizobium sp.]|uniref:hypothetical protein n=1 Tax=Bradyrhizobium sp. TaxID=376 RepID=UPI002384AD72|nr:hypothetical protein [Bradyrhizobium sp.]MDE1937191.1 hypothetical protein [Bradyrhizobium sp.]
MEKAMYENFEICPDLKAKEFCIVVREYQEGQFHRRFHEHIPKHRISEERLSGMFQALVLKFQNNEPLTIMRSFLNARGKEPSAFMFMWRVTYPEAGVLRKYCGTNVCAWADEVIVPANFRKESI